jgi:flagellin
MAMSINTNVMSLNAQRHLSSTNNSMATSMERLASGMRINSAKDDAAGLAVTQKMLGQIKSLDQAVRNANDGISMIQTAEGAMQETQTMLQRMRELATQAASDTISDTERGYINTELQQLKGEINNIADRTEFNGQKLLTGALSTSLDAASELNDGDLLSTTGGNAMITDIDLSGAKASETYTFTGSGTSLTLTDSAGNAHTLTVNATAASSSQVLDFGSLGVKVTIQADAGGKTAAGLVTDITAAAYDTITTAAGNGNATIQVGADAGTANELTIGFNNVKVDTAANGASAAMDTLNTALGNFNTTSSRANASAMLTAIDGAIDFISSERSTLGAKQNRLNHTVSNLQVSSENMSASRGRIVDADYASETANLTRTQILQQAGTAMLSQANSAPQGVLALLQ